MIRKEKGILGNLRKPKPKRGRPLGWRKNAIDKSVKDIAAKTSGKVLAYSPFLFFAWQYYATGSLQTSVITCIRDFLWPIAVGFASCLNASPY